MDGSIPPSDATEEWSETDRALLEDAIAGLGSSKKHLSPKWLYDQRGSELFEEITKLDEYYPTRTETAILRRHARELAALVPADGSLVELGSGASVKTRILLDAGQHFGTYVPIDISEDFLHLTADDLRRRYPQLDVRPVVSDFTGPVELPEDLKANPKIGFFPGSTIGNLDPVVARQLLENAHAWPGVEGFILGADLVKDVDELVAAYDDSKGVTASFISNVLVRLNHDLAADFDLSAFDYRARWDADLARIDMVLVSICAQTATLAGQSFSFESGEEIHVSAARKYTRDSIEALAQSAGWAVEDTLSDDDNKFAVCLLRPL